MALKVLSALETSKITVPAPSDTTDAATKQYVDNHAGGGSDGSDGSDLASIVPAFSSSKTYALNTYVSYEGTIYKCTTAVTTAGAFSSSNWTEVSVALNTETSNAVSATKIVTELLPIADPSNYSYGLVKLGKNYGDVEDAGCVPVLGPMGELHQNLFPWATNSDYGIVQLANIDNAWVNGDNARVAAVNSDGILKAYNSTKGYFKDLNVSNSTFSSTLGNVRNGWKFNIANTANTGTIKLPAISTTTHTIVYTFEMILNCQGSSGSVTITFQNSSAVDIPFLDSSTNVVSFERGYTHFLVFRNYNPTTGNNTTSRKWVGNIQGKVPL